MHHEGPRVIRLTSSQARRCALAEQRRQEIYAVSQSFELAYLDALCETLHRRIAHLRRQRRA